MSDIQFQLNRSGVRELMKSDKMQSVLKEYASGIKGRLGEGYEEDTHIGKNRANAMVYADSYKAKIDNLKNNTILKAVRG